jgi:hypothetical protein
MRRVRTMSFKAFCEYLDDTYAKDQPFKSYNLVRLMRGAGLLPKAKGGRYVEEVELRDAVLIMLALAGGMSPQQCTEAARWMATSGAFETHALIGDIPATSFRDAVTHFVAQPDEVDVAAFAGAGFTLGPVARGWIGLLVRDRRFPNDTRLDKRVTVAQFGSEKIGSCALIANVWVCFTTLRETYKEGVRRNA